MSPKSLGRAVIPTLASLCLGGAAQSAELILFDGPSCSGEYRMVDRSVQDLRNIGFDNRVESFFLVSGEFGLYRDAGFGQHNGRAITTRGLGQGCHSISQVSSGNFPADRLSSIQAIATDQEFDGVGVVVLFDLTNFRGEYRIVTRDIYDFRRIGFDNQVESIMVVSGEWTFYRNAGFGAPLDRPSVTLGPGDYADIAQLPGYGYNHFPGNLMSAAQVAEEPAPPLSCQDGEIAGETSCHSCWEPFDNLYGSSLPDPHRTAQCVCAPGFSRADYEFTIQDGVIFLDCQRLELTRGSGADGRQNVSFRF